MTSTPNQRSIHIDAPVEKVFDHIKDPSNFVAADPEPVHLSNVSLTPEGVGSTWETSWRAFGLPLHAVVTRAEFVPNRRIVDRASTGVTWTYRTEPDPTGTTLYLAFAITTKLPLGNRILNRAFRSQGRQLEKMLTTYQEAIQA
ncbi:hypothetical protein GCM10023168_19300 [Fodinibacter luteus]|uniref:SRPBCC family protein n=1 Tax=Fodinibacter luteus TaxID=552064 RepID=A0ABP8KFE3_9MICO